MSNRIKIMILILLFWINVEIALLVMGFSGIPVLIFVLVGSTICNLIGMFLDVHSEKVSRWFDSKEFFKTI